MYSVIEKRERRKEIVCICLIISFLLTDCLVSSTPILEKSLSFFSLKPAVIPGYQNTDISSIAVRGSSWE